mgnify:CR=1 FL=1
MQNNSTLILTLVMAAGTILTRFLPFILFPDGKQMPRYVEYLGHVLPYATMGILVLSERRFAFFSTVRDSGVPCLCISSGASRVET